jgi:hypothetical protein
MIPDPDLDFLPIPGPEVEKAPDPESRIRIRNTGVDETVPKLYNVLIASAIVFSA